MKVIFRNVHLYLALASGIVIAISCFTGAALVFEKELQHLIYPKRYSVEERGARVALSQLIKKLQTKVPGAVITNTKIYSAPERSVELTYTVAQAQSTKIAASEKDKKPDGKKKSSSSQAFMNPYTGELISLYNHRNTFFHTLFSLHRWLLAGDTGKLIVGISTSVFLFILATGIILWWPTKKKKLKQGLKVKVNAEWKRINHDLHVTIGFYASIFLFSCAFTGLAWSFDWANNAVYWITGSENKRSAPPVSVFQAGVSQTSFDKALWAARQQTQDVSYYSISMPSDSIGAVTISVLSTNPVHEKASDQYFFDQYNATLLKTALYKDRNLGQRVRSTFYPIHVGSIGGLPGRILVFISCIVGTSLPVTGTILWINRLKKQRKKRSKKDTAPTSVTKAYFVKSKVTSNVV
jgi:uncharacterized iron-regulated membrane protein